MILKNFAEIRYEITQAIKNRLNEELKEDGLLEGVQNIVYGDFEEGNRKTPAIFFYTSNDVSNSTNQQGFRDERSMTITLICLYRTNNHEEGIRESERIVSNASSALVNRKLGIKQVQNILRGDFQGYQSEFTQGNIFGSVCTLNVFYTVEEKHLLK